ncbi:MAG: STAS domain-containing protein [Chitinispirillaceae bacterium]|nr:STAS domain-containing protein [Chitinispirillaceae bacterium]
MSGIADFRAFENSLRFYARKQFKKFIIDFGDCVYIDSHAIALIITASRRMRMAGTRLIMQNANQEITELFHAIQINKIIEIA